MTSLFAKIISPFLADISKISDSEFTHCVELARRQGIEMLFYSRLNKHYKGEHKFVDEYLKAIKNNYLQSVARSMRQEALEKQIINSLAIKKIPACVIKGNAIARIIYLDSNCRSSGDIDVLIKVNDLIATNETLYQMGFIRSDLFPLAFAVGRAHHLVYDNAKKGCQIEMHWDFGYPLYFNLTPEQIWNGIVGNREEGYQLTPETMVVMLLAHHFRHGFRELKVLVDILWSIYSYDRIIDWHKFVQQLKGYGMIKTALITIHQLESLWNINEGRIKSLKSFKNSLQSMPIRPHRFFIWYFRMNIEEPKYKSPDMQIAKLVLDRKSKVLYSFLKIFFPRSEDIKAFYPETSKRMLPVNYLRFILWRLTKLDILLNKN